MCKCKLRTKASSVFIGHNLLLFYIRNDCSYILVCSCSLSLSLTRFYTHLFVCSVCSLTCFGFCTFTLLLGLVCFIRNIIIQLANACLLFRYIDLVKQWKCAYAYFRTNLYIKAQKTIYCMYTKRLMYGVHCTLTHSVQCLDDKFNSIFAFLSPFSMLNGFQYTEIDGEKKTNT